jgi:DHA2 family multidrug resistance protein
MLDKGQQDDWLASRLIQVLLIITVVSLPAFVIRELRAREPVVNLRVFKDRTYSTGVGLMTLLGFVLYGSLVSLPLFLQVLLRYPSVQAGIAMVPRGLGSFIGMPVVGMVMNRFDPRKLLAAGIVGSSLSLIQLSRLNLNAGYWDLFWPQFFQGLAMSLVFVPLTTITMSHIAREDMGHASSMFNFMRNIGGSMGIATAATMIARDSQTYINILGANVTPYRHEAMRMLEQLRAGFMAGGSDATTAMREASAAVWGMVQQQAMLMSYLTTFRFFGTIFLALLPFIFLMRRPAHQEGITPMH